MALPHRRVTELRDGPCRRTHQHHDSGIHSTSTPSWGSSPTHSSPDLPTDPPQSSSDQGMEDPDKAPHPGRGRPKKRLNSSAKRGIIRLFVEMSKTPLLQITTAIEHINGHGKLWIRGLLEDVSDTGPQSDHRLGDIRFEGENPTLQALEQELFLRSDEPTTFSQYSSSDESNPRRKAPRRTTSHVFADVSDQQLVVQAASPTSESPRQDAQRGTVASDNTERAILTSPSMFQSTLGHSQSGPKATAVNQQGLPPRQTTIRFHNDQNALEHRDRRIPGDEADRKGGKIKGRRRGNAKRRGPSLTLTDVAMFLDGGIKGIHYQVAKVNTIRRRMSSATSEFNRFYRRPTNTITAPLPTPCPYPLSPSIRPVHSQNAPRPEAVATNVITAVWAEGLNDIDARKQLEAMLPIRQDELKTFVSAQDDLGASPLHLAVAYGYPHTCQLLLQNGADPNAKTHKGTSIYDFAESAARRTGEDLKLYFRILHCRKFVCGGRAPPAPRKSNNVKKGPGKRKKGAGAGKAAATPGHGTPEHGGLRIDTRAAEERYPGPYTTHAVAADVEKTIPQWAPEYTNSPAPSIIHKHLSLPLENEDLEDHSSLWRHIRRSTAAVPFPTSSHYSGPSMSMIEPHENTLTTSESCPAQGVPIGQRSIPQGGIPGYQRDVPSMNTLLTNAGAERSLPQSHLYSISQQLPRQLLAQPSALDPFGFSQDEINLAIQRSAHVGTASGNVSYGLATPAWAMPNSTSAAIDFADVNPVSNAPYTDMMQGPMDQGGCTAPFQSESNLSSVPTQDFQQNTLSQQHQESYNQQTPRAPNYDYQQDTLHQQPQPSFYNQQTLYQPPPITTQNMSTTYMPYVSVAAHRGAEANDPNTTPGIRICPFGDQLCDGNGLCEPCLNAIFFTQ